MRSKSVQVQVQEPEPVPMGTYLPMGAANRTIERTGWNGFPPGQPTRPPSHPIPSPSTGSVLPLPRPPTDDRQPATDSDSGCEQRTAEQRQAGLQTMTDRAGQRAGTDRA